MYLIMTTIHSDFVFVGEYLCVCVVGGGVLIGLCMYAGEYMWGLIFSYLSPYLSRQSLFKKQEFLIKARQAI